MPQLRIALAQINSTVGDIAGNTRLHLDWARQALDARAHVVVFPEMSLTGYPVEDLSLRSTFAQASRQAVDDLAGRLVEAGCACG
ncbi:nitrilase-related carbon-nitrogen hydrolase [Hymenobacter terrigena]